MVIFTATEKHHVKKSLPSISRCLTCICSWSYMCFEEINSWFCPYPRRSTLVQWFDVCVLHMLSDPPLDRSKTASRSCISWEPWFWKGNGIWHLMLAFSNICVLYKFLHCFDGMACIQHSQNITSPLTPRKPMCKLNIIKLGRKYGVDMQLYCSYVKDWDRNETERHFKFHMFCT